MYGKQTECAIAAVSRLAEVYDNGRTRLSAAQIADARGLQRPRVAKCLATLSQAGIVVGAPGPGGGFTLAAAPAKIKLYDVYCLFEREADERICPFGGGKCGVGDSCPLHDRLVAVRDATADFLDNTTFEVFRVAYQEHGWRPQIARPASKASGRRLHRTRPPARKRPT